MRKELKKEILIYTLIAILTALALQSTALWGKSKTFPLEGDNKMQILFLGDSNIAYDFEGVCIPIRVMEALDASVYNCAVGGTTAAKVNINNYFDYNYDLFCLYHLSKVMTMRDAQGVRDFSPETGEAELLAVRRTELLADIDYEKIDYVVISYGLNDYTSGKSLYGEDAYDETTYAGALRLSIEQIMKICPNAKIILSSITYCVFYGNGELEGDGYSKNWGGGYINEYRDAMEQVAAEYDDVYFQDNLEKLGINESNFNEYLRDDMHLNSEGQKIYVECLTDLINEIERESNE